MGSAGSCLKPKTEEDPILNMDAKIKTTFMIISDTHLFQFGDAEKVGGRFQPPTHKVDVLLHAGDLTQTGGVEAYEGVIRMLGRIDAELRLVIAGNHDLSLDKPYWHRLVDPEDNERLAEHEQGMHIMKGPLAQAAGVTYLDEGLHNFTLKNGANFTIYASPYQPEFFGWAFAYERDQDRFNFPHQTAPHVKNIAVNPIPDFPSVDIMMTHGPPKDILDWVVNPPGATVGCNALLRAVSRARPLLYCFGHIHEAYGGKLVTWKDDNTLIGADAIEQQIALPNIPELSNQPIKFGKQTLMINAAIMDLRYKPTNSPWFVNLELPRAS